MTFNALLNMLYVVEVLAGVWKLNTPYIPNDAFFWLMVPAIIINIFPAVTIGRMKSGRLWFHHYVYGLMVSALSLTLLVTTTHVSPISLFTTYIPDVSVNVGRFFIVGGLTLVVDDLPDVSKKLSHVLSRIKSKVYEKRRAFHVVQVLLSFVSFYFSSAILALIVQEPEVNWANLFLAATLLVTSLTSFSIVKRKIWLNITPEENS